MEDPEEEETPFASSKKPQFLATGVVTVGSFGLGTVLGWSSPAIPNLEQRKDFGILTPHETSWIASLAVLGALLSGPAAGYCINRIGRRMTMLLLAFPFILGWIFIAVAGNLGIEMIYTGRFITGLCGGAFTVTIPVYVSEIAEDSIRGTLASVMVLMLVTGILFTFVVGAFVSWMWLSIISSFVPVILLIGMLFLPESPRYLLTKGKTLDAINSLKWLRGASKQKQIESEFIKIQTTALESRTEHSSNWKVLLIPSVLKPTVISLFLFFFQQMGGVNGVTMFTVEIFDQVGTELDPNVASIIIGIVQVFFVFASLMLVNKIGRKHLLVASDLIMSVSLCSVGIFFYYKENNNGIAPDNLGWLPLISIVSYIVAYSFGAGPLPWLLMSEYLPPHAKGLCSAIVTFFYWILAFISSKTFEDMTIYLKWSGTFWIFSVVCFLGGIFTLIFAPETRGKSSEEIQKYFGKESIPESASQNSELLSKDDNLNETKRYIHDSSTYIRTPSNHV